MTRVDDKDFVALKLALQVYAQARAALPPEQRAPAAVQELGELLVTVVSVADRLNVDLVSAAEAHIATRAANQPRLATSRTRGAEK